MKKNIRIIVISLLFFFTSTNSELKANQITHSRMISTERIDLGNGLYKDITIYEDESINRSSSIKSGHKVLNYVNNGTVLWSVSVDASFSYNGLTSNCISASSSASSYNADWKIINHYARKNGSTGTAYATTKQIFMGITLKTVNEEVNISCSKSGVLS